ncbi:unnamed protein product [Chrysoparadoxa australica]
MPVASIYGRRIHRIRHKIVPFLLAMIWFLLALTFFEVPQWCKRDAYDICARSDQTSGALNSGVTTISETAGYLVELACLFPLCLDLLLISVAYPRKGILFWARVAIPLLYLIEIAGCFVGSKMNVYMPFRLAPLFRASLLVLYSAPLKQQINLLLRIVPEFFNLIVVLVVFIGFCGWYGTMVFSGAERREWFPSLEPSMWNILVTLTTANFPDVMIPAFSTSRASCTFFVLVLAIGLFLLMNLVLASVYDKYCQVRHETFDAAAQLRETNVSQAYHLLATTHGANCFDGITPETLTRLLVEINRYKGMGKLKRFELGKEQQSLFFEILDTDNDADIDSEEFKELVALLQLKFKKSRTITFMELWYPEVYVSNAFRRLKRTILSPRFELAIDICLIVNAVLIYVQYRERLQGHNGAHIVDTSIGWVALDLLLTGVYAVEMGLKIVVLGIAGYASKYRNIFDGAVTLGCIASAVTAFLPGIGASSPQATRFFLLIRLLRLGRGMISVPQLKVVLKTVVEIGPDVAQYLMLIFFAMYIYSWLGTALFGGIITVDPGSKNHDLLMSMEFGQDNYFAINFNDMGSAMTTLFILLVVNNWHVIVDGYAAMCGEYHRLYFVTWYAWGVLMLLNIVIAVILEAFQTEWKKVRRHEGESLYLTRADHSAYRVEVDKSVHITKRDEVIEDFKRKHYSTGSLASVLAAVEAAEAAEAERNESELAAQGVPTPPRSAAITPQDSDEERDQFVRAERLQTRLRRSLSGV